jgi:hypothetical protein
MSSEEFYHALEELHLGVARELGYLKPLGEQV